MIAILVVVDVVEICLFCRRLLLLIVFTPIETFEGIASIKVLFDVLESCAR